MFPARNVIDAHAQDFVAKGYPSRMHSHSALARCAVLEMLDAFALCVLVRVEWHKSGPVSLLIARSRPHSARKNYHTAGTDHLLICLCIYCDHCTIRTGR
jgi:hypothetical protein